MKLHKKRKEFEKSEDFMFSASDYSISWKYLSGFFSKSRHQMGKEMIKRLVRKPEQKIDADDGEEIFPIQQQSDRLILGVSMLLKCHNNL